MGWNTSWQFVGADSAWLGPLLRAAPGFKRFEAPYYEYYSPTNTSDHPDAIASVTATGIDWTDFGDPQVLAQVLDFLRPHVAARCGEIREEY